MKKRDGVTENKKHGVIYRNLHFYVGHLTAKTKKYNDVIQNKKHDVTCMDLHLYVVHLAN